MQKILKHKVYIFGVLGVVVFLIFLSPFLIENNSQVLDVSKGCADEEILYLGLSKVELAKSLEEQTQGMMFRENVCESHGMLFVYDMETNLSFWMKNTPTSLDIIFLSKDGRINTIHKSTNPYQTYPLYSSSEKSQFVLEVKSGFTDKNDIKVGDYIDVGKVLDIGVEYGS